ncbi:MAG: CHASE4 domain-containing protein, partial [Atribacterota bacterium]
MKRWFFSFVPGKKNILIVLIALIGAISGILVASRYLILDSFAELEKNEVARNVQRVLSAITDDIETLHQIGEDWASWDDTYQFMGDRNENYIQSNLVDETFLTLNLNQMVFVKPGGQILFSKAMDL